jgi:hypothetical protein
MARISKKRKDRLWMQALHLLGEVFNQKRYRQLIPLFKEQDEEGLVLLVQDIAGTDIPPKIVEGVCTIIRLVAAESPEKEQMMSDEAWLGELYLRAKQYCAGEAQYMKAQLKNANAPRPVWL